MEQRLTELESRVAFQEDAIQKLNDVIVYQQKQIEMLGAKQKMLQDQLQSLAPSLLISEDQETPPPHY